MDKFEKTTVNVQCAEHLQVISKFNKHQFEPSGIVWLHTASL